MITYLKVDVEGAELKAFRQWIDSGNGSSYKLVYPCKLRQWLLAAIVVPSAEAIVRLG
jgi:hypothetical protein